MQTFGLIGNPLGHSFSKKYFEKKFKKEGLDCEYLNFELNTIEEFPTIIEKHPELAGLNVTIPYKQQIIRYLDKIDKEANFIGAVNTIKFERSNSQTRLIGYNTDAMGFEISIKHLLKKHYKKALILGTGGASKAVEFVLKKNGIAVREVSRRPLKANQMSYGLVNKQIIEDHQVIINTTPLGMHPDKDAYPDIPYKYINEDHLLVDLIYNPEETIFLKKGKENGATVINGEKMLLAQAEQSWKIWNH